jgi:hypothetical protein
MNEFPLADPSQRARHHGDDVTREQPLFIDPATEDPELLIAFRDHVPYPVGNNARGRRTIESLGLGRGPLSEDREDHFQKLWVIYWASMQPSAPPAERARFEDLLRRMTSPTAEYAAMSRTAVAKWRNKTTPLI